MRFDDPVPHDGYAWWYVDALSPDGRHGLTLIAFVGSVFSPYYAAARAQGPADPLDHCALNVCLYLPRATAWTLTERRSSEIHRADNRFRIGPSGLHWDGRRLEIDIEERTAVRGRPVRGRVVVTPGPLQTRAFSLGAAGRHHWRPLSVQAEVEVDMEAPAVRWRGEGYVDQNWGSAPLERDFRHWSWSRAAPVKGLAQVFYEVEPREGPARAMALEVGAGVGAREIPLPPLRRLGPSAWMLPRTTRHEGGAGWVVRAFEDTPFYSRSSLKLYDRQGRRTLMMHERLDLDRFASPLMQWALPYRIPQGEGGEA